MNLSSLPYTVESLYNSYSIAWFKAVDSCILDLSIMQKSITNTILITTLVASVAAIVWAVLPAGTLPGDKSHKQQIVTQYLTKHRQVKVVRFVHKKAPAVATVASSASSGSIAGTSYAQATPVAQRAIPTAPVAAQPVAQPREREDSQENENHDEDKDRENGENQDG